MKNHILRKLIILFSAPVIGFVLLMLVHLLPTGKMFEHVYWSLDTIVPEFQDETVVNGYRATLTGNFTDCIMLLHAIYDHPDHSVVEQSVMMYRPEFLDDPSYPDGWQPGNSLVDYVANNNINREVSYGRYWHGYLIFLKPLLLFASFGSLRLFFAAFQLVLLCLIVIELTSKGMKKEAWAFLISMPFMFFFSTFASLSLSVCFYLVIFTLYILIRFWDKLEDKKLFFEMFLVFGILTSYFDFLTYPLVTLGYPLVYFAYKKISEQPATEKKNSLFVPTVLNSLAWFIGYGFMWMSKWLIAGILGYKGLISNAVSTVDTRLQSAENMSRIGGFFRVIGLNLKPYLNRGFFIYFGIIILVLIVVLIFNRKSGTALKTVLSNVKGAMTLLFIAVYPFIWFAALENHSEQHWIYTCRIFAVTVFAISTFLVCITENRAK